MKGSINRIKTVMACGRPHGLCDGRLSIDYFRPQRNINYDYRVYTIPVAILIIGYLAKKRYFWINVTFILESSGFVCARNGIVDGL